MIMDLKRREQHAADRIRLKMEYVSIILHSLSSYLIEGRSRCLSFSICNMLSGVMRLRNLQLAAIQEDLDNLGEGDGEKISACAKRVIRAQACDLLISNISLRVDSEFP